MSMHHRTPVRSHWFLGETLADAVRLVPVGRKVGRGCAGAHTRGVTPDPFPNSVVKTSGPMVVLMGESRLVPAFSKAGRRKMTGLRLFLLFVNSILMRFDC